VGRGTAGFPDCRWRGFSKNREAYHVGTSRSNPLGPSNSHSDKGRSCRCWLDRTRRHCVALAQSIEPVHPKRSQYIGRARPPPTTAFRAVRAGSRLERPMWTVRMIATPRECLRRNSSFARACAHSDRPETLVPEHRKLVGRTRSVQRSHPQAPERPPRRPLRSHRVCALTVSGLRYARSLGAASVRPSLACVYRAKLAWFVSRSTTHGRRAA
jgi:hypothetical protein